MYQTISIFTANWVSIQAGGTFIFSKPCWCIVYQKYKGKERGSTTITPIKSIAFFLVEMFDEPLMAQYGAF